MGVVVEECEVKGGATTSWDQTELVPLVRSPQFSRLRPAEDPPQGWWSYFLFFFSSRAFKQAAEQQLKSAENSVVMMSESLSCLKKTRDSPGRSASYLCTPPSSTFSPLPVSTPTCVEATVTKTRSCGSVFPRSGGRGGGGDKEGGGVGG